MTRTTVAMGKPTRERLKSYGRKDETYDQLLNRLLDEHAELEERVQELERRVEEFVVFQPIQGRRRDAPTRPREGDHGA